MALMIIVQGEEHVSRYPTSRILSLAEVFLPRLNGPAISIKVIPWRAWSVEKHQRDWTAGKSFTWQIWPPLSSCTAHFSLHRSCYCSTMAKISILQRLVGETSGG